MKRANQTEIAERTRTKNIQSVLFLAFIMALIPFVNAIWYWVEGGRQSMVAENRGRVRAIYWGMALVLFLLPVISMASGFVFLETRYEYMVVPALWIGYLLPAWLVARKHVKISLALGTFYSD